MLMTRIEEIAMGSHLRCNPIRSSWLQRQLFYWTEDKKKRNHVTCAYKYPLYGSFLSVHFICNGDLYNHCAPGANMF
jgi:hypothetical protein